jgi:hypothetical protein
MLCAAVPHQVKSEKPFATGEEPMAPHHHHLLPSPKKKEGAGKIGAGGDGAFDPEVIQKTKEQNQAAAKAALAKNRSSSIMPEGPAAAPASRLATPMLESAGGGSAVGSRLGTPYLEEASLSGSRLGTPSAEQMQRLSTPELKEFQGMVTTMGRKVKIGEPVKEKSPGDLFDFTIKA